MMISPLYMCGSFFNRLSSNIDDNPLPFSLEILEAAIFPSQQNNLQT